MLAHAIPFYRSLLTSPELSGDIALLRTTQRLPFVQAHYDQLAEELQSVTAGEILEAQLGSVWVSRSYPDCIRSGGTLTYRSRASYEEVARIYSQSLQNLGWNKIVSVTSGRTRGVSQINFGLDNGSAILSLALLSEFSAGLPEYQTIYEIRFYFAEPSVAACYG
jgi:hypothetical protein